MIRIDDGDAWILVEHRDHAELAGRIAAHWGNPEFPAPEPRQHVVSAVTHHDDAWADRDALPRLTSEGRPSAFSRELVGAYSAFEEMDFAEYLAVRSRAAAMLAADNPYAALVVSMHTVDLLTTRADLEALGENDRRLHAAFIAEERRRQEELRSRLRADPEWTPFVEGAALRRAFEFLQACDSLSLLICVRYSRPLALRHQHPRLGSAVPAQLMCTPLGGDAYRVAPYPFDQADIRFDLPCRRLRGRTFPSEQAFRAAWSAAPRESLSVRLVQRAR